MNSKPLISICIPTYNRCNYLQKSIESIISQAEFKDGKVEIVISDNASTDNTQFVVQKYTSKYKNIRYFRNSENISIKNFPLALSRGNGLFRKLSNDTFLYCKNSLKKLCILIDKYSTNRKIIFLLNGNRKDIKEEIIYCNNFSRFTDVACSWTAWSGGFGIWENECDGLLDDTSGCELLLWQCKKIYSMVAQNGEAIIYNSRLLIVQEVINKDRTYGLYKVLYENLISILNEYLISGMISETVVDHVRKEQLYILTESIIRKEINTSNDILCKDEDLKKLVFCEIKNRFNFDEYMIFYEKKKKILLLKLNLKNILNKLGLLKAVKNVYQILQINYHH